jgi:hypothetical protein
MLLSSRVKCDVLKVRGNTCDHHQALVLNDTVEARSTHTHQEHHIGNRRRPLPPYRCAFKRI